MQRRWSRLVRFGLPVLFLVLVLAIGASLALFRRSLETTPPSVEDAEPGRFPVGYTVHRFTYPLPEGGTKDLTIAIWYPGDGPLQEYRYDVADESARTGLVALAAPVDRREGPYPLIVFSHSFGSCGVRSTYITQYLASRGYIVAAPDHGDARICSIDPGKGASGVPKPRPYLEMFPHRPSDVSAAIDELLRLSSDSRSLFWQAIDERKIGGIGHSLGGWTMEVLAGALDNDQRKLKDERLKAELLLAPANNFSGQDFEPDDFNKIHIPLMFLNGDSERIGVLLEAVTRTPPSSTDFGYEQANPPKYFGRVRNADHLVFSDAACAGPRIETIEECQASRRRAATILTYATAFLDHYVRDDPAAGEMLQIGGAEFAEYEFVLR